MAKGNLRMLVGALGVFAGVAVAQPEQPEQQPVTLPIEALMRDLQVRNQWLQALSDVDPCIGVIPLSWGSCDCGGLGSVSAPAYPADGFFAPCMDDPEKMAVLVNATRAAAQSLAGAFLHESWHSLDGKLVADYYNPGPETLSAYAALIAEADEENFRSVFEQVQNLTRRMVAVLGPVPEMVEAECLVGSSEPPGSDPSCASVWEAESEQAKAVGPAEGCQGVSEAHKVAAGGEPCEWIVVIDYHIGRCKYKISYSSCANLEGVTATANVFLAAEKCAFLDGEWVGGPDLSPPPPVPATACDDAASRAFHIFDSSVISGDWQSKFTIEDTIPVITLGCGEYGTCEDVNSAAAEWRIVDQVAVFLVAFSAPNGSGQCGDDALVPTKPQDKKDGDPSKSDSGTSTGCGGQGAGASLSNGDPNGAANGGDGARGSSADAAFFPAYTTGDVLRVPGGWLNREFRFMPDNPSGPKPVNYAWGYKHEAVTDLAVPVTGYTFSVTREYASRPQSGPMEGYGLVGANWTLTNFRFLVEGDGDTILHAGSAANTVVFENVGGVPEKWRPAGTATHYIIESTSTDLWPQAGVDDELEEVPVWTMIQPGAWEVDFYRSDDPEGVDPGLHGLVREWRDYHGNRRTYLYSLYDDGDEGKSARLRSVYLNSEPDEVTWDASLYFSWFIDESDAHRHGRLRSISVFRRDQHGNSVVTEEVAYRYMADADDDRGSSGDLIQVERRTLVDGVTEAVGESGSAPYRLSITQYRYHNDDEPGSEDTERLETSGEYHQLKMIIEPEQIEYYAQQRNEATDDWAANMALSSAAAELMTMADGDAPDPGDWPVGSDPPMVVDLASKIVSYEPSGSRRMAVQFIQSGCGCSAPTQAVKEVYTYLATTDDVYRTCQVDEHRYDGGGSEYETTPYRSTDVNLKELLEDRGYNVVSIALIETGGRTWVEAMRWDDSGLDPTFTLTKYATPASIETYSRAVSTTAASVSIHDDEGLVYAFAYNAEKRPTEVRIGQGDLGSVSNFDLLGRVTYFSSNAGSERTWLPKRVDRFRTSTTSTPGESAMETRWFTYGFRSGDSVAWIRTFVEAELEAENGPTSTGVVDPVDDTMACYDDYTLFDASGRTRWTRSSDSTLTYMEYDDRTGAMTKIVRNADPVGAGSPNPELDGDDYAGLNVTGWGRWTANADEELTSTFEHDLLGRMVASTSPGGVRSFSRRELRPSTARPGILYYASLSLPHQLVAAGEGDSIYDGPVHLSIMNAGGRTFASHEYALDPEEPAYDPPAGVYTLDDELGRSTVRHTLSGLVASTTRWQQITPSELVNTTTYEYDELGRTAAVIAPDLDGTSTRTEFSYDVQDRVVERRVGTTSQTPVAVASYYYDDDDLSNGPHQGTGNGNLNYVRTHTGDSSLTDSINRDVRIVFDWRDRLVITLNPLAPHEVVEYDNLGRVTRRGLFTSLPTQMTHTDRTLYAETEYSQRGLVYRQRVAVDASQQTPAFLETHAWFDGEGRAIATWGPNSPAVKRVFDAYGRTVVTYVTDRAGDALPGSGSYADAASVGDDHVLEQVMSVYDQDPQRWAGRLLMTTTLRRMHDDAGTGALAVGDDPATFVAYYYDEADRMIRSVNFGTNTEDDVFQASGETPAWPPSSPPEPNDSSDRLISAVAYDVRGLIETAVDPSGKVTAYRYDALGRQIAVVENFDAQDPPALAWTTSPSLPRWTVTSGLDPAGPDVNRVTSFVYDAAGHVVQQIAHLPDDSDPSPAEKVQVTHYVYGTTMVTSPTDTDSLVASAGLLREVRYPNETTGEAGGSGDSHLKVRYAYNRLGELRSVIDQSGTTHVYLRDDLGRVKADRVDALGTNIDGAVRRIGMTFDAGGRLDKVTSYSNTGGTTPVNEVMFTYTPLWQVAKVFQDHDGVVTQSGGVPSGNTQLVAYAFATAPPASGDAGSNYSRVVTLTYPDETEMTYDYRASESIDDRISRVASLSIPGLGQLNLAEYQRIGLDMMAIVDYPASDIQLDRTLDPPDQAAGTRRYAPYAGPAGVYPGYDRFGRVRHQAWVDGDLTTHSTASAVPNVPPILYERYAYDKASNRVGKYDRMPGWRTGDADEEYAYDGLHRLTEARRGRRTGATTWAPGMGSQDWVLDMLGNWVQTRRDLTGNGSYTDTGDQSDERTHNAANEIGQRDVTGPGSGSPVTLPFAYDDAGNLRNAKRSSTTTDRFTHDAWNRMVKHEAVVGTEPEAVIALGTSAYNGLHWRIRQTTGSMVPGETRLLCYSAAWQLLEEHVHRDGTFQEPPLESEPARNWVGQVFWGVRYIDDAILRRLRFPAGEEGEGAAPDRWVFTQTADHDFYYITDVQFSVRAMVPTGAKQPVAERVRYEAYGRASHWHGLDGNFDGGTDASDSMNVENYGGMTIADGVYYRAEYDFNRDGVIDGDDLDLAYAWEYEGRGSAVNHGITDSTRPWQTGLIPGPDNPVGYCGYVHVKESGLYAVRFRWYDPATGRWLQRDPAGYQDGPHLFQYGRSAATRYVDYIGKQPVDPPPAPPDPSEDIHLAENDKSNGCGIKVYQADVGNGYGHRWLVIPDPGRGKPGDIDYRPRKNVLAGRQPIGWQTPYSPDPQCCADDAPSPGGADTEWNVAPIPYWAFVATPDAKHVKLEHGPSKGTLFEEATCEQIRQCLLYRITNEHYNYIGIPGENCRNGASNALMECGMGLTNKRRTAQGLAKDEAARAAFYRAMERLGEQRRPRW